MKKWYWLSSALGFTSGFSLFFFGPSWLWFGGDELIQRVGPYVLAEIILATLELIAIKWFARSSEKPVGVLQFYACNFLGSGLFAGLIFALYLSAGWGVVHGI
jgi:hypothetical protein